MLSRLHVRGTQHDQLEFRDHGCDLMQQRIDTYGPVTCNNELVTDIPLGKFHTNYPGCCRPLGIRVNDIGKLRPTELSASTNWPKTRGVCVNEWNGTTMRPPSRVSSAQWRKSKPAADPGFRPPNKRRPVAEFREFLAATAGSRSTFVFYSEGGFFVW